MFVALSWSYRTTAAGVVVDPSCKVAYGCNGRVAQAASVKGSSMLRLRGSLWLQLQGSSLLQWQDSSELPLHYMVGQNNSC